MLSNFYEDGVLQVKNSITLDTLGVKRNSLANSLHFWTEQNIYNPRNCIIIKIGFSSDLILEQSKLNSQRRDCTPLTRETQKVEMCSSYFYL